MRMLANYDDNSLKLKRPQTARKFRSEIDRMYVEINEEASKIKPRL